MLSPFAPRSTRFRCPLLIFKMILGALMLSWNLLFAKTLTDIVDESLQSNHPYITPIPMVGNCNGSCIPNQAYPCIYAPFYPVTFTRDGRYRWDAPFQDGSGIETGVALMLTKPEEIVYPNGSWTAKWYGGNRIESSPKKTIHCACFYVGGNGEGKPWTFHSFQIKKVDGIFDRSVESVCGDFNVCPETESKAVETLGHYWIERFFDCKKE